MQTMGQIQSQVISQSYLHSSVHPPIHPSCSAPLIRGRVAGAAAKAAQTSFSPATSSSSSWGNPRRFQTNRGTQSFQRVLGLPGGLLPEGRTLNALPGRQVTALETLANFHLNRSHLLVVISGSIAHLRDGNFTWTNYPKCVSSDLHSPITWHFLSKVNYDDG